MRKVTKVDMENAHRIDMRGKLTKKEVTDEITLLLAKGLIEPLAEVAKYAAPGLRVAMIVQFEVVNVPEEFGKPNDPDSELVGMAMTTTLVGMKGYDQVESCVQSLEARDDLDTAKFKAGEGRLH